MMLLLVSITYAAFPVQVTEIDGALPSLPCAIMTWVRMLTDSLMFEHGAAGGQCGVTLGVMAIPRSRLVLADMGMQSRGICRSHACGTQAADSSGNMPSKPGAVF